jgi:hypothetical protein
MYKTEEKFYFYLQRKIFIEIHCLSVNQVCISVPDHQMRIPNLKSMRVVFVAKFGVQPVLAARNSSEKGPISSLAMKIIMLGWPGVLNVRLGFGVIDNSRLVVWCMC